MPALFAWAFAFVTELNWQRVWRTIVISAFGVLLLTVGLLYARWKRTEHARVALAFRAYNDSARADHLQGVAMSHADSLRLLGDSLAVVTRLAVQEKLQVSDFDKKLNQERVATVGLQGSVRSLRDLVGTQDRVLGNGTRI